MRLKLLALSLIFLFVFTSFSYSVAKESFQNFDFDTTVKLQDHISRRFDVLFSYFSLLGSAEITIGFCLILSFLSIFKKRFFAILGWLMIIPASMAELFGKLVLFHPAPPVFLHRTIIPTTLPSFYVHTDFSYPSGHLTRTIFIVTILLVYVYMRKKGLSKFISILGLLGLALGMGITRVYLGEHWSTDVIGGALLGIGMGFFASVLIFSKKKL